MKTISRSRRKQVDTDDLAPEYSIDYSKSKPNRFASRMPVDAVAVVLDPDVAEVFRSPTDVNNVLRALLATMPARRAPKLR